jgi:hypothetical protein
MGSNGTLTVFPKGEYLLPSSRVTSRTRSLCDSYVINNRRDLEDSIGSFGLLEISALTLTLPYELTRFELHAWLRTHARRHISRRGYVDLILASSLVYRIAVTKCQAQPACRVIKVL